MKNTLVLGARGTVGSELARLLTTQGHTVVRATSNAKDLARDQVFLDLTTQVGVESAFRGVDRAFFLSPSGHTRQDALLKPVIDQAAKQGLKKIVLMTAMGVNADDASPMRQAELHLEQSGVPYNIIRPNWFMQNFNSYWLAGILGHNKIALPVGKAKGSFIDARDISATVAALLSTDRFDNKDFDLTGPVALDHDQVAAILSRTIGRTITFADISPEQMREQLLTAGVPSDYTSLLITILGHFKAGHAERTTDAVFAITGQTPRTFEQYAQDHRAAWLT